MDRKIFHRLFEERIVMLDGATGSNLMQAGMPVGVCPEKWILEHPQHLIKLRAIYSGRNKYSACADLYGEPDQSLPNIISRIRFAR